MNRPMNRQKSRLAVVSFGVLACMVVTTAASAKPKTTKSKKKKKAVASAPAVAPVTAAPAAAASATRNFTCLGTPNLQLAGRQVTGTVGTVGGVVVVTNVTVSKTYELVNNTMTEKLTVDITSPNPPGELDLGASGLMVFRLNERPPATAADVDRLLALYQLNFKAVLPPGPNFEAGLYFDTVKGRSGPAVNEYSWAVVSSLAAGGAYGMKCSYV
jgi:hypothetical protein